MQSIKEETLVDYPIGFAFINEPRTSEEIDAEEDIEDSIGSTQVGIAASVGASKNHPEFISLVKFSPSSKENREKLLDLSLMENQLDSADYQFTLGQLPERLRQTLQKRSQDSASILRENLEMLSGLAETSRSIQRYQRNLKFLKNPGIISTFKTSLSGLEYPQNLSNTGVFLGGVYSQLLPASCQFSWTNDFGPVFAPAIEADSVSNLLTALSQNDITSSRGFQFIDSILPEDPIERIALIVESLSYELSLSVGMKKLNISNLADYLRSRVGITPSPIDKPPEDSAYLSFVRDENVIPLEPTDVVVNGESFNGVVTGIIEPDLISGDFSLNSLSSYSANANNSIQKIQKEFLILSEDYVSEERLLQLIFESVSSILNRSLQGDTESAERVQGGVSLISLLLKTDNAAVREARYDVFVRAFGISEVGSQAVLRNLNTIFEGVLGNPSLVEFIPNEPILRKGTSDLVLSLVDFGPTLSDNPGTRNFANRTRNQSQSSENESPENQSDSLSSISLRPQNAQLSSSIIKIVSGKKFSNEMFPYATLFDFSDRPRRRGSRENIKESKNQISKILSNSLDITFQPLMQLVIGVLDVAARKSGNINTFQNETLLHRISKRKIEFLLFQVIVSVLSLVSSIKAGPAKAIEPGDASGGGEAEP